MNDRETMQAALYDLNAALGNLPTLPWRISGGYHDGGGRYTSLVGAGYKEISGEHPAGEDALELFAMLRRAAPTLRALLEYGIADYTSPDEPGAVAAAIDLARAINTEDE